MESFSNKWGLTEPMLEMFPNLSQLVFPIFSYHCEGEKFDTEASGKRLPIICVRVYYNYLYYNYHLHSVQTIKHLTFFSSELKLNATIAESLCI